VPLREPRAPAGGAEPSDSSSARPGSASSAPGAAAIVSVAGAVPPGALGVEAGGEHLLLLPERVAFWPRTRTLLVADAHLGKAAAFRCGGIPVPSGTTDVNLERLTQLVFACDATRIVFLGDLVHSKAARQAVGTSFAAWRQRHAGVDIVLVRGNHDARAGDIDAAWNVRVVSDPLIEDGLALCHAPRPVAGAFALAGHLHPSAMLTGRGRDRLRVPCFWFAATQAVLPAFGAFTGTADIAAATGDRVFVVAGSRVVALEASSEVER